MTSVPHALLHLMFIALHRKPRFGRVSGSPQITWPVGAKRGHRAGHAVDAGESFADVNGTLPRTTPLLVHCCFPLMRSRACGKLGPEAEQIWAGVWQGAGSPSGTGCLGVWRPMSPPPLLGNLSHFWKMTESG